jgi:chaperone modulatory protein CbpM
MTDNIDHPVVFLDDSTRIVIQDMLRLSGFSLDQLVELVECGAFEPEGVTVETWTFTARSALIARRAAGLRVEFGLDIQGTSLVLGLLDRIDEMERRLRELEAQLSR